jgi:Sulfotransferase domain
MSRCNDYPAVTGGPSFLFIGAAKAGSSWFFEILREHPEVFVPPNRATYFFCKFYDLGIPWYESFFSAGDPSRVRGEVCHDYLVNLEALRRIRSYRPSMRIVCCLRNPYERAISAWRFYTRNGLGCPSLAEQGAQYPDVFAPGYYGTHLSAVHSLFPQDQVLVFFFEDIFSCPQTVASRLYEFIGVAPDFVPPSLYRRVNVNGRPRSRTAARLVHNLHMRSWGRSRLASNAVGLIKAIKPLRQLVKATLYRENEEPADWRAHLSEFPPEVVARYEEEITILGRMLGRDLSAWRAPSAIDTAELRANAPIGVARQRAR